MKNLFHTKKIIKLLIYIALVFMAVLLPVIFFNEFELYIIPFFLDFAAHHYFILAFIVIMIVMLIARRYLKKKESLILINKNRNEENIQDESCELKNNQLEKIVFSELDVLDDHESKNKRLKEILLSLRLGLIFRKKVTIYFKDLRSNYKISDLIIKKREDMILLNKGGSIPINRIYKIEISK